MAKTAHRRKPASRRNARMVGRRRASHSPGRERNRWRAWAAMFALGVVLGGGLGGAFALVSSREKANSIHLALPATNDSMGQLIERTTQTSPEPAVPDPAHDGDIVDRESSTLTKSKTPVVGQNTQRSASGGAIEKVIRSDAMELPPARKIAPASSPPAEILKAKDEAVRASPIAIPSVSSDKALPLWRQNAVASFAPPDKPAIAIVLDDVGVARAHAELAIALPPQVTLSFMTYAEDVADLASRASAKGHELLLHFPMEPLDRTQDPGPNALLVGLGRQELQRRLDWGLSRFDGYVGINNHMGSRFTSDSAGMRVVMETLRRRGLLFLDSKTVGSSVGGGLASELNVAHVIRDVFLDNEISSAMVARQLQEAERVARANGTAIAIGHPHPATMDALRRWIPDAQSRGFAVVPLSAIALRQLGTPG